MAAVGQILKEGQACFGPSPETVHLGRGTVTLVMVKLVIKYIFVDGLCSSLSLYMNHIREGRLMSLLSMALIVFLLVNKIKWTLTLRGKHKMILFLQR